jgi:hypothetical protein
MSSCVRLRALAATAVCAVGCVLAAAAFAAPAGAASFRTVDVPGAAGTQVAGVNDSGTLAGNWGDTSSGPPSGLVHGFIERPGGQPIAFNDPAAGCCGIAIGINDPGTTVGIFFPAGGGFQGLVRSPDGSFATLVETPSGLETTQLTGINDSGLIVGQYQSFGAWHGFVDNRGTITTLDAPGAGTGFNQGTFPAAVNNSGVIVGAIIDASGLSHGFLYRNGTFTKIPDAPGAGTNPAGLCSDSSVGYANTEGSFPTGISASGVIVGGVCNDVPAPNSQHGWVLSNGQFSPLNDPNAGPGGTQPTGISENGRFVAGMYLDAGGMLHGFTATLTP